MESTGRFNDGSQLTSLVVLDTGGAQLPFQKDEDNFVAHVHSIADYILKFETQVGQLRKFLPVLDIPHILSPIDYWQAPLMRQTIQDLKVFTLSFQ